MTPDELRIAAAILLQRGISEGRGPYSALARRIERPLSTLNNWLSGRTPVPAQVARHINDLLEFSEAGNKEPN